MAGRARFTTLLVDTAGNTATVGTTTALKNTDGTALTGALYAAASGGSPLGITNIPCNAQGRVDVYRANPGPIKNTYNGVTVTDDFWPDSSDIMTFAAAVTDGITATIRDKGGWVFHLESFATTPANIRGTSPSEDPDTAWAAAFAAIAFVGGGTLVLGPYTYLPPTAAVTWTDDCVIRGAGIGATIIWHRNSSQREPIYFLNRSNCGVTDLTVNGNYTQNTTFASTEISIDGTNNFAYRVQVLNFNKFAITCGGSDNSVDHCILTGLAPESYFNQSTLNFQSLEGIQSPGNTVCKRIKITNNTITGMRDAAIFVGGIGFLILNNTVEDCHRGDFGTIDGTQGGMIATAPTKTTVDVDTPPQHGIIGFNTIGPMPTVITSGGAIGIEIDNAHHILCIGNTINNVSNVGIKLDASGSSTSNITLANNSIHSVDTVNAVPGSNGSVGIAIFATTGPVTGVIVSGGTISSCANAIWTFDSAGTVSNIAFWNITFDSNTRGWTNGMASSLYQSGGHTYLSTTHERMPNKTLTINATGFAASVESTWAQIFYNAGTGASGASTSNGLWVRAGTLGSDYILHLTNGANSLTAFDVYGNGSVLLGGSAVRIQGDFTNATHATRTLIQTKTANGDSFLGVITNGSGTTSALVAYSGSDPDNAAWLDMASTPTVSLIRASKNGSGSYTPLRFSTSGTQRLSIEANGDSVPGTAALATNATTGFMFIETCAGTPTGVPTTYTGRAAAIYDTTAHKWWVYDQPAGAWKSTAALT